MTATIETGRPGRLLVVRLRPNLDLVTGVEDACRAHGIAHALVRSGVGSLVDAALGHGEGAVKQVAGPGIEILTLLGEVRPGPGGPTAMLSGTIGDAAAQIHGGVFLKGRNPVCITLELVLEEWLPQ
ncbi:MAG: DNA-binding protein [Thalassobaculales bacterium]